ncbi:NlpC/P60 family protein [Radiobacillus deserti]|uniref:NlpC/P60 family protein n=1 Tax=Radiobacillus deserti TaxID=2594883 RepID=A0A516KJQ5_9BACI|nr:NlpC/P60 family protein [Radiobacillus deserti]QDP41633.1 NlpC/P60 family protein [Radiobacillus deserti]
MTHDRAELGDLLLYVHNQGKGRIHHVGVHLGGNRMIHVPKIGKHIEIIPLEGTIYEEELVTIRR